MVRRCCVENCTESDLSILAHRFPKTSEMALKWQTALNITSILLKDLQTKSYVVCTKHFKASDYRNQNSNCLNSTAVPNFNVNSDNERIQTTKGKDLPKFLKSIKCHKASIPSNEKRSSDVQINKVVKKIRIQDQPSNTDENFYEIDDGEEDDDDFNSVYVEIKKTPNIQHHEQSTMTESKKFKNQEVQTTLESRPPPNNRDDKDDKMIALLYPKYAGANKIDLIKMLIEKDLKIKSLEEKEQKLENALTSLL